MGGKAGENPAALRAAVFLLASKNLRGGGRSNAPPPPAGRGLIRHHPISHVFDRYRYPPVPATARGTCRGEGVGDTLSLGHSTTASPIAFKFGV